MHSRRTGIPRFTRIRVTRYSVLRDFYLFQKYSLYAKYSVLRDFGGLDLTKISSLLTFLRKITAVCLLF